MRHYIGIEAGGTKFICALGDEKGNILKRVRIQTSVPEKTLPQVFDFIEQQAESIAAIGIACFGPLELDKQSPQYGYITSTPKLPWVNFDMVGAFKKKFSIPIGFDTDVNTAALGEYHFGAAKNIDHFIYTTVGTGIGTGAIVSGQILHGAMHLEAGHMLIPHDFAKDPFQGVCPYHQDCLEGLASGPAMKARWLVQSALDLPKDHEAWDLEADYLAIACMNFILTLSPKKIILGGGVMKQTQLFPKIRQRLNERLQGYIKHAAIIDNLETFISPTGLGENSGICGTIALANLAYQQTTESA